nr:hypothetical protein [Entomoplasma sp. MP1]
MLVEQLVQKNEQNILTKSKFYMNNLVEIFYEFKKDIRYYFILLKEFSLHY